MQRARACWRRMFTVPPWYPLVRITTQLPAARPDKKALPPLPSVIGAIGLSIPRPSLCCNVCRIGFPSKPSQSTTATGSVLGRLQSGA